MKSTSGPLLELADLTTGADGQVASARYGDIYASRAGALGQARTVYLAGCGLLDTPARWAGCEQFTILETGFGLGVNFLATWAAWRADPQRCGRLDYVSLELHPVRAADLLRHAPPELQPLAAELAAKWPPPVRGLHRIVLDEGVACCPVSAGQSQAVGFALPALAREPSPQPSPGGRGGRSALLRTGSEGRKGHRLHSAAPSSPPPLAGGGREGHPKEARSAVLTSPTRGGGREGESVVSGHPDSEDDSPHAPASPSLPPEGAPPALGRPGGGGDSPHAPASPSLPPEGAPPALGRPGGGGVHLLLAFGDAATLAPRLKLAADALYLDGFAPARNPAMWTPELLRSLARLSKPGARAASYTVAHAVQKALSEAGFEVELQPGFSGKRQRLQATFNPIWRRTRHTLPTPWPTTQPRQAVVIGAGLTGAACAHALAQSGWTVEVIEAGAQPAGGGSAMPAGLAHLQPSADDNLLSRLTRAGMAELRRALPPDADSLAQFGPATLTPADAADARRMQHWRRSVRLPAEMAQWTEDGWQVDSAVLANQALCTAWLTSPRITLRCHTRAARLHHDGGAWHVLDAAGKTLARAPLVLLASALQTPQLLADSGLIPDPDWLPLRPLRGQAQALPARLWPALQACKQPWMGSSYVLRLPRAAVRLLQEPGEEDWLLIGATFESEDQPLTPEQAWAHNRAGLSALASSPPLPEHTAALRHFVGVRAASADRLPYCGLLADMAPLLADPQRAAGKQLHELPRLPGLAVCAGLGSRGLTLAPLLAETLLAQIEGTPLPIETDLADAIDPARVALRRLRHSLRPSQP